MSELDDAGTYFNLSPRKVTSAGSYHYMCTRNNNFSNRDQKGKVTVEAEPFTRKAIGQMGGTMDLDNGLVDRRDYLHKFLFKKRHYFLY